MSVSVSTLLLHPRFPMSQVNTAIIFFPLPLYITFLVLIFAFWVLLLIIIPYLTALTCELLAYQNEQILAFFYKRMPLHSSYCIYVPVLKITRQPAYFEEYVFKNLVVSQVVGFFFVVLGFLLLFSNEKRNWLNTNTEKMNVRPVVIYLWVYSCNVYLWAVFQ